MKDEDWEEDGREWGKGRERIKGEEGADERWPSPQFSASTEAWEDLTKNPTPYVTFPSEAKPGSGSVTVTEVSTPHTIAAPATLPLPLPLPPLPHCYPSSHVIGRSAAVGSQRVLQRLLGQSTFPIHLRCHRISGAPEC